MATAFIADRAAATFPVYKPIGAGVMFVNWGTYNAATALVINDTIAICTIPANTYVLDGYLVGQDIETGTTMELDVGFAANGVDAADPVGFIDSGALAGAATAGLLPVAGLRVPFQGIVQSGGPRLFTANTTVMIKVTVAPTTGTGRLSVYCICANA
jgi:hypothetical protein